MIELVQNIYFLHKLINMFLQLVFIKHLDSNKSRLVSLTPGLKNATELASTENFRLRVDNVIAPELFDPLLSFALVCLDSGP